LLRFLLDVYNNSDEISIVSFRQQFSYVPSHLTYQQQQQQQQHHHHHQQQQHQGLDPLIRSVSRVTAALANAS
jgi:hypothetical protein